MNLERLILKAKRLLHLDKQVETRQQQSVARLEKAWRQADEYKKANPLNAPEEAIFDAATFSHLRRYSGSDDYFEIALTTLAHDLLWHTDDYFESALAALRQFRVQQAEWRARPVKRVTIVPEVDWQPDWRQERRLALLFEPQIAESWGAAVIKQVWLPALAEPARAYRAGVRFCDRGGHLAFQCIGQYRDHPLRRATSMARQFFQHSGGRRCEGSRAASIFPQHLSRCQHPSLLHYLRSSEGKAGSGCPRDA